MASIVMHQSDLGWVKRLEIQRVPTPEGYREGEQGGRWSTNYPLVKGSSQRDSYLQRLP